MTCYESIVAIAQKQYKKIYIDLANKTLRVSKQIVIENGQLTRNKIIIGDDEYDFDGLIDCQKDLNELYRQYKYSVPSEKDDRNTYFKALPASEMTDEELVNGMPRFEAKIKLEVYILLASIAGLLTWEDDNHWFWQGKDKDFIILKQYI